MSKARDKYALIRRLEEWGFTYNEANTLRRIEMTLQRWGELECGDSDNYKSWSIERDEKTDRPYMTIHPHTGKTYRYPVADREKGALKRLAAIVGARNARAESDPVIPYHQGDPRGCCLYLVRRSDLPTDYHAPIKVEGGWSIAQKGGEAWKISPCKTRAEAQAFADRQTLSAFYTRGIAVCA